MRLQENYNKNRITQAPEQSRFFFEIWEKKGLLAAIKWFYNFKRYRQGHSFASVRTASDLLGSTVVALGLAKWKIGAIIAFFLMISVGGTSTPPIKE